MKKFMIHAHVVAFVYFLMLTCPAWAVIPYRPLAPVEIMTAVTAENVSGIQPDFFRLIVGPVQTNGDAIHVGFFNAESGNSIGSLNFFPAGVVAWDGKGAAAKRFQANDLLMMPGISVPVDVLPINRLMNTSQPAVYEFQSQAGDRTFMERIQISVYSVSNNQARQSQWLRLEKDMMNIPIDLRMLEAVDLHTGVLVVKQLWAPGSDWWLYEETPFRRSWRIE